MPRFLLISPFLSSVSTEEQTVGVSSFSWDWGGGFFQRRLYTRPTGPKTKARTSAVSPKITLFHHLGGQRSRPTEEILLHTHLETHCKKAIACTQHENVFEMVPKRTLPCFVVVCFKILKLWLCSHTHTMTSDEHKADTERITLFTLLPGKCAQTSGVFALSTRTWDEVSGIFYWHLPVFAPQSWAQRPVVSSSLKSLCGCLLYAASSEIVLCRDQPKKKGNSTICFIHICDGKKLFKKIWKRASFFYQKISPFKTLVSDGLNQSCGCEFLPWHQCSCMLNISSKFNQLRTQIEYVHKLPLLKVQGLVGGPKSGASMRCLLRVQWLRMTEWRVVTPGWSLVEPRRGGHVQPRPPSSPQPPQRVNHPSTVTRTLPLS